MLLYTDYCIPRPLLLAFVSTNSEEHFSSVVYFIGIKKINCNIHYTYYLTNTVLYTTLGIILCKGVQKKHSNM